MTNIFSQYAKDSSIFSDKDKLSTSYVPDIMLHREKEIAGVAEIIGVAFRGDNPSNLFQFGKSGTGKTAVVRYIGKQIGEECKEQNRSDVNFIYINCGTTCNSYDILATIGNSQLQEGDVKIPPTGLSTERVFRTTAKILGERPKRIIVALDEVDKLVHRKDDNILYQLAELNNIISGSHISLIGISNDTRLLETIDSRVRSRLNEESLIFNPYDAHQLKDILEQRAKMAFHESVLDDNVIPYCAAVAAQYNGDARYALNLLRISGELAERKKDSIVTESHLKEARGRLGADITKDAIRGQPTQAKVVAAAVLHASEKGPASTGQVYQSYRLLCNESGMMLLAQRRIGDIIGDLNMAGVIDSHVTSHGRGGRITEASLAVTAEELIGVIKEDDLLAPIVKYFKVPSLR